MSTLNVAQLSHAANSGDPNIELNADGSTSLRNFQAESINGSQVGGFRNQLINGSLLCWQRGSSVIASNSGDYTADRWFGNGGANYARINFKDPDEGPVGFAYGVSKGEATAAFAQMIELPNNGDGSPFDIGTVWTASYWTNGDDHEGAEAKIQFMDTVEGGNVVLAAPETTYEKTGEESNGYFRVSATFTINDSPDSSNLGLRFNAANVAGQMTGFQLEPGPVATPFEHRSYGTELQLCQRFYYDLTSGGNLISSVYKCNLFRSDPTVGRGMHITFPVTMRATPTISATIVSGTLDNTFACFTGVGIRASATSNNSASTALSALTADAEL